MMTERRSLSGWFNWSSWFTGRSRRAAAKRKAEDFADYGTAFGLDMSLDHQSESANRPTAEPAPSRDPASKR